MVGSDMEAALIGIGLAAAAGGRGFLVLFGLGAAGAFGLIQLPEAYQWVQSTPVLWVFGLLTILEQLADESPDFAELFGKLDKLPRLLAGFIAFSAARGYQVDPSLVELLGSGLLGAGTAGTVGYFRDKFRLVTRQTDDLMPGSHKLVSRTEAASVGTVGFMAVYWPIVIPVLMLFAFGAGYFAHRWWVNRLGPCIHCEEPIPRIATVCRHCRGDQVGPCLDGAQSA